MFGISTFYGHLSAINVKVGQDVSQGQIIGYVGHTGYTIPAGPAGCHVHFEVRGARNPFAK
jgi:murein DD-endopeptidase MepM/ murein hydrolase activator NlpD